MKPTTLATLLFASISLATFAAPAAAQQRACQVSPQFANNMIQIYIDPQGGSDCYWSRTHVPIEVDDPLKPGQKTNAVQKISASSERVRNYLVGRRALEEYAEFLSPLKLPRARCASTRATAGASAGFPHYSPGNRWINMCYGMLNGFADSLEKLAKNQAALRLPTPVSLEQLQAGAFSAILLHETGHALFDLLNVPMFGGDEDAADQMAALVALEFGKETARTVIKGFAYLWKAEALQGSDPGAIKVDATKLGQLSTDTRCAIDAFCGYSDSHGTASQRMYNVLCMAYGGRPEWFEDFVKSGWLPPGRQAGCRDEYRRAAKAFQKTVAPFIDARRKQAVMTRQWFQPAEMKER